LTDIAIRFIEFFHKYQGQHVESFGPIEPNNDGVSLSLAKHIAIIIRHKCIPPAPQRVTLILALTTLTSQCSTRFTAQGRTTLIQSVLTALRLVPELTFA
jgi:hypothetical protein